MANKFGPDHRRAPLYEGLETYLNQGRAGFHVPGHHSGAGVPWGAEERFRSIMEIDLTELPETDDLHAAEGIIREAQVLAADAFGADQTFFLVGGSTAGNLAMILSLCGAGDLLIVQRDVHKSVIHGLMLARCRAVFLAPQIDAATGLSLGVTAEQVGEALRRYPEAKGVLLTNPSYHGVAADLRPVVETAHAHGKPVLVDEAHGAHFAFHPELPPSAMACGADAAVQSAHKMLNAMTMGAMLHVQGGLLNRQRLAQMLAMVQSSSPSYPIMASLDLSRRDYALHGREKLGQAMDMIRDMRSRIAAEGRFMVAKLEGRPGRMLDPFKAALYDRSGKLSGYRLAEELSRRGVAVEMADPRYALLVLNASTPRKHLARLEEALRQLGTKTAVPFDPADPANGQKRQWRPAAPRALSFAAEPISEPVPFLSPSEPSPAGQQKIRMPVEQCAGRLSAEMIIPYPPGIPLLYPGETIRPAVVEALVAYRQERAKVQGAEDPQLRTIAVYA